MALFSKLNSVLFLCSQNTSYAYNAIKVKISFIIAFTNIKLMLMLI